MQWAFRGHVVVLCDEFTGSDGEAFTEGFRRLGLGKVIGTRTWGGEIWLTASNFLVDKGIATAAEFGVPKANGSSKVTASIPTSWWKTCRTRLSKAKTRNSTAPSNIC